MHNSEEVAMSRLRRVLNKNEIVLLDHMLVCLCHELKDLEVRYLVTVFEQINVVFLGALLGEDVFIPS